MLDIVHREGIEWINVFAVDNVLQRIADPCFIGATIQKNCVVGSKVVRKNAPDEKVGVMCLEDGRPSIVEYYELTDELMNAKDEKGEPAYNYGVILNYLFKVQDLEKIMAEKMPLHIVEKKIPYLDAARRAGEAGDSQRLQIRESGAGYDPSDGQLPALRGSQKKRICADQEQDRCGLCGKCQRTAHREWCGAVNISTDFHNIRLLRNR